MSQERGAINHQGQLPDHKVVRLKNPRTWCYVNTSINFLFPVLVLSLMSRIATKIQTEAP